MSRVDIKVEIFWPCLWFSITSSKVYILRQLSLTLTLNAIQVIVGKQFRPDATQITGELILLVFLLNINWRILRLPAEFWENSFFSTGLHEIDFLCPRRIFCNFFVCLLLKCMHFILTTPITKIGSAIFEVTVCSALGENMLDYILTSIIYSTEIENFWYAWPSLFLIIRISDLKSLILTNSIAIFIAISFLLTFLLLFLFFTTKYFTINSILCCCPTLRLNELCCLTIVYG